MLLVRSLFDAPTSSFTYLVASEQRALLIDPVLENMDRYLQLLAELDLALLYSVDTHIHADHITGSGELRQRTGCQTVASNLGTDATQVRLADGDHFALGELTIKAIATPGHTADGMSYLISSHVFTGDTLLVRSCGRCDFQSGSAAHLYQSITQRLFALPNETTVWPGHDYVGQTASTIGEEKRFNARVAGRDESEFVHLMANLNLPVPKLLHQAVPANWELGLGRSVKSSPIGFRECLSRDLGAACWDRVVDVRAPFEYEGELGHLPDSDNVPVSQFPAAAENWNKEDSILVVCRSGRRSRQICEELASEGFAHITNLQDGMVGYRSRER